MFLDVSIRVCLRDSGSGEHSIQQITCAQQLGLGISQQRFPTDKSLSPTQSTLVNSQRRNALATKRLLVDQGHNQRYGKIIATPGECSSMMMRSRVDGGWVSCWTWEFDTAISNCKGQHQPSSSGLVLSMIDFKKIINQWQSIGITWNSSDRPKMLDLNCSPC